MSEKNIDTATMDATWRIMDGLHESIHATLLVAHKTKSDLVLRQDASIAGYVERVQRIGELLQECAVIIRTPAKLTHIDLNAGTVYEERETEAWKYEKKGEPRK